ncbi:MAG: putative ABC transporter permease [Clostridia bacterium]|nr:putative ABC transporter permease [Clostridia bacterium]
MEATTFLELARCTEATGIPVDLRHRTERELNALRRAADSMDAAQKKTAQLADELQARMNDVDKAVNRKWYKANPPANGSIDLHEKEKDFFARGMNGYKIALVLFIGSFVGVVIELIWCLIRNGYLESRSGLVWGPFNALYGIGAAALSLLLYRFRNRGKWLSFLGGMAIGSVVEYLCSWGQEMVFGSRSWDYSDMPFNVNGRICLLYSVFWGFLGVLWIKDLYPRMVKWLLKLPNRSGKILTWVLMIFLGLNCIVSTAAVYRWSERVNGQMAEHAIEAFLDERFPNERMEAVYANMTFGEPVTAEGE